MGVIVERCNMPLRQLLERDGKLRDEIEVILSEEPMNVWNLSALSRTFCQMMLLDKGNGVSAISCNAIMECMEERDQEDPIYMEDVYPYLKQNYWEIHMNEVSYYKVHVQNTNEWSISLDRIEKGYDDSERKDYLDLFPFKECEDVEDWEIEEQCYRVYFDAEDKYKLFIKDILLDGEADLSKV